MKPIIIYFFLFFSISLQFGCTPTQYLSSDVKPKEIGDLLIFEPSADISFIGNENLRIHNDTLSEVSKYVLLHIIDEFKSQLPKTQNCIINDPAGNYAIEQEIQTLCKKAELYNSIKQLKISPVLDALLEKNAKRYGLIILSSGYRRGEYNYYQQKTKREIKSVTPLGWGRNDPVYTCQSNLVIMILDSQENNIAFFNKSVLFKNDPIDENVIRDQFKHLFKGYFWK